jgi:heme-degrading monooxygenase HmoA
MVGMMVRHKVSNYAAWKTVFDAHGSTRKSFGSKSCQIFRDAENANQITVLFEWDTLENARRFTEASSLREAMEKAGVEGRPEISFLTGGERQEQ